MVALHIKIVNRPPLYLQKRLPKKIAVMEVSAEKSRRLNCIYRNKNSTANVLSFRYDKNYGEILICPAVIRREAKEQNHTYKYQMTWMILHGMLHLAGIHHEKSKKVANRIEKLEEKVLGTLFHKDKKQ